MSGKVTLDRAEFHDQLELMRPGINLKENVPQSAYYVFDGEYIRTFNDHVSCRFPTPCEFVGAVHSQKLLPTIAKFPDEVVDLHSDDEGRLVIKGRGRRSRIMMQSEIEMEVDAIEEPEEDDWIELPPEFTEAIPMLSECYMKGTDLEQHLATCVSFNFEDGLILANDGRQACEVRIDTLKEIGGGSISVTGDSIKPLRNVVPTAMAVTDNWVHFTNHIDMLYSARLYDEAFPDMSDIFNVKGAKIVFPSNVQEVVDRAKIHSSDNVDESYIDITLGSGVFKVKAVGLSSDFAENRKSTYEGEEFSFSVDPDVLVNISRYKAAVKSDDKPVLLVKGQGWKYLTLIRE